jgi:hypothetical protein
MRQILMFADQPIALTPGMLFPQRRTTTITAITNSIVPTEIPKMRELIVVTLLRYVHQ